MGFFGALNREFARILVTRPRPDREGARESYARHYGYSWASQQAQILDVALRAYPHAGESFKRSLCDRVYTLFN
jgi:hypothetical protein